MDCMVTCQPCLRCLHHAMGPAGQTLGPSPQRVRSTTQKESKITYLYQCWTWEIGITTVLGYYCRSTFCTKKLYAESSILLWQQLYMLNRFYGLLFPPFRTLFLSFYLAARRPMPIQTEFLEQKKGWAAASWQVQWLCADAPLTLLSSLCSGTMRRNHRRYNRPSISIIATRVATLKTLNGNCAL
jgi:hypothetical protein